jgi:tRNA(Arg) A34 adenosine deaminase TadA
MPSPLPLLRRRHALALAGLAAAGVHADGQPPPPLRWYRAAEAMRRLALGWGDQPYGAVVVQGDRIVGEGPSRVVRRNDPDAHAEREAIRDARERFGPQVLQGAVLYSTSRPCALCEAAAARAGIVRMVHGPDLQDAGAPVP